MRGRLITGLTIAASLVARGVASAQTGTAAAGSVDGPAGRLGVVGVPPPGAAGAPPGTDVLAPGTSGRIPLSQLGTTPGQAAAQRTPSERPGDAPSAGATPTPR